MKVERQDILKWYKVVDIYLNRLYNLIMFIFGIIIGFLICLVTTVTSYFIVRELLIVYGKDMVRSIKSDISMLKEATSDTTAIVFPEIEKEVFLNKNSNLEDLIQK